MGVSVQNAIKALMTVKEMSVSDVAKLAGISNTFVANIKKGKSNMSYDVFLKLAKVLGVKGSDLMRLAELEEEGKSYQELLMICSESVVYGKRIYGNY